MEKGKISFEGSNRKLPDGWKWVRLEDICRDISDGTHFTPTYIQKGVPFLSVKDIRETGISFSNCRYISEVEHQQLCKRCKPERGDVLYTKVGTTGIAKAIDVDREFSIFVSVALLKLTSDVTPEYLEKVLNSPICRKQAEKLTQGAANRNLVLKDLKRIEIPIAPLNEQKRIAAILSEQMEVVEKALKNAITQFKAAKELPEAYLRGVFNSPEAQQWDRKKLGELAILVQNGIYKSADNYIQGHPFLRMYNIQNYSWILKLEPLAQVLLDPHELEKHKLKYGDILISRVNSFELVGKCAFVNYEAENYVFENMLIRIRLSDLVDSMFIAQQINSKTIRKQIQKVAKRAIGQASINSEDIRKITIILPQLSEQKRIAATLTEKMTEVERLCKTLEKQLEAINKLPASLLRQAFNGEL